MFNFTKTDVGRSVALGMQALKRIGKPEDVADVVAFLASGAAAKLGMSRSTLESKIRSLKIDKKRFS
jgi:NAD(P)-dependent dehydrogenase (short-subunit alcohol dehydrogenase family)